MKLAYHELLKNNTAYFKNQYYDNKIIPDYWTSG